jgi:predicted Zn finger-like uncharacterized protein
MKTQCPNCKARFNVDEKFTGKQAKCPKCTKPFTIQPFSEVPAAPSPPAASPKPVEKPAVTPAPTPPPEPAEPTPKSAPPPADTPRAVAPPSISPQPMKTTTEKITAEQTETAEQKNKIISASSAVSAVKKSRQKFCAFLRLVLNLSFGDLNLPVICYL